MTVRMVHWPSERDRRDALCVAGRPRLLLVAEQSPAPLVTDPLEDWIRLPASEEDLQARLEGLQARLRGTQTPSPELDGNGILRVSAAWVALAPVEVRLMQPFLVRLGAVVSRQDLQEAGWPGDAVSRNALDVHILRLRRRIGPLGLTIRTVRSRGYVLDRPSVSSHLAVVDA